MSNIRDFFLVLPFLFISFTGQSQDINVIIHLRGVFNTKISLLPLSGPDALKPVFTFEGVKNGDTATLKLTAENLPGEFVIRFDYKENITSTPNPSEKHIIVYDQNLDRI